MKFVLVNGRRPRPESFCALCCESIGENYLRELRPMRRARGLTRSCLKCNRQSRASGAHHAHVC
jgi:hypothetical protein